MAAIVGFDLATSDRKTSVFSEERAARARGGRRLLLTMLLASDALALSMAVALSGGLRLVLGDILPVVPLGYAERHLVASLLFVPTLLALFGIAGLYNADRILAGSREYGQIASAVTHGVLVVLVASYFVGDGPLVSRSWLMLVWLSSIAAVAMGRFTVRRIVRRLRRHGMLRTRVAIVGASPLGIAIAEQMQATPGEGLDIVGFLDEYIPLGQMLLDGVAVVGRPGDLAHGEGSSLADEFVLVPQALPHERLEAITRLMVSRTGPTVRLAVSSSDLLTHGVRVAERASVPLVTVRRARIVGVDALLKRALDLSGAFVGLLALAPFVAAALVRGVVAGRRPLLVTRRAVQASGATKSYWTLNRQVASSGLVRGAPALLAVLLGRLSLVGPRPDADPAPGLVSHELQLTAVNPGLTGPWKLCGPSVSSAEQSTRDLAYVRGYTIWEDVRILWESLRHAGRQPAEEAVLESEQPAATDDAGDLDWSELDEVEVLLRR